MRIIKKDTIPFNLSIVEGSVFKNIHRKINEIGFSYSSIGIFDQNILGSFSSLSWQKRYLELELYKSDNLTISAINQANTPVFWGALPLNTKKESLIMQSRYEITGCFSGVSIAFDTSVGDIVFALGSLEPEAAIYEKFSKISNEILTIKKELSCLINN
jgi:hypothetical protein